MKKIIFILLFIGLSNLSNAQYFSLKLDAGISRLHYSYPSEYKTQNKSQLYYGLGISYSKISDSSSFGYKTSLEFNKRGYGSLYEGNSGIQFYGNQLPSEYVVSENSNFIKSLSLTFTPTLNIFKRVQLVLGPSFSCNLKSGGSYKTTYYKTSEKKEIVSTTSDYSDYSDRSFANRWHIGLNAGFNFKVSNLIDLGINYQYLMEMKYDDYFNPPNFSIINISTNIFLTKRE
jgi:hypothetical protein